MNRSDMCGLGAQMIDQGSPRPKWRGQAPRSTLSAEDVGILHDELPLGCRIVTSVVEDTGTFLTLEMGELAEPRIWKIDRRSKNRRHGCRGCELRGRRWMGNDRERGR